MQADRNDVRDAQIVFQKKAIVQVFTIVNNNTDKEFDQFIHTDTVLETLNNEIGLEVAVVNEDGDVILKNF